MSLKYINSQGMVVSSTVRQQDRYGCGEFRAPRGILLSGEKRFHMGVDYKVEENCEILSPVTGTVTKIGYPYAGDLSFRYVEIRQTLHGRRGKRIRIFYVDPAVKVGDIVHAGVSIGGYDSLDRKYPGITPHCHFEVRGLFGRKMNPELWFENMRKG